MFNSPNNQHLFKALAVVFIGIQAVFSQCIQGNCTDSIGTFVYKNQERFEGLFENGTKKTGKYTYKSGAIYEGSFKNNQRHGYGSYSYVNGDVFSGEFENDQKVFGTYAYNNGNVYFGQYLNNKPNGFGKMSKSDGSFIEGFWVDGTPTFQVAPDTLHISDSDKNFVPSGDGLLKGSKAVMPRIFGVIVGISEYSSGTDLNYADDDARIFYRHLLDAFPKETAAGELSLLIDYDATHDNIIQELNRVFAKANSNDYIIFFFSGHGNTGIFAPTDNDQNVIYHREIKSIFKASQAKYRLCIADACHAGSIGGGAADNDYSYNDVSELNDARLAVLLSSTSEQTSMEQAQYGQGLFSYFLMKGIRGEADLNGDKYITAGELFIYTRRAVVKKSGGQQVPTIIGQQLDKVPLARIK
ncbi:MAG: hypothetical protein RL110_1369 [Bacteroidota bacterium]|jgi:hypothetical protein